MTSATWRKSRRSGNNGGNCVEVTTSLPRVIAVRDSKNPDGGVVKLARETWESFTSRIKAGDLT